MEFKLTQLHFYFFFQNSHGLKADLLLNSKHTASLSKNIPFLCTVALVLLWGLFDSNSGAVGLTLGGSDSVARPNNGSEIILVMTGWKAAGQDVQIHNVK